MKIEIKHNSKNHVIELPDDATLGDLKAKLAELTKVPPAMQKLTGRPNLKDDTKTCVSYGIRNNGKLLLVGNPVEDVVSANKEDTDTEKQREEFVRNLPGNFWALPPYCGMLADPFIEGKGAPIEGGSAALSLTVLDMVLSRINTLGTKLATVAMHADAASSMDHPFLTLTAEDRKRIAVLHSVVRKSQEFANQAQAAVKPEDVITVVESLVETLKGLKNKEYFIVPSGYIGLTGHNIMYMVICKDASEEYTVTVVNTSPSADAGLDYHTQVPTSEKIKAKTCITLPGIPGRRILDEAFWLMTLSMWMKANDGTQSEFCRGEVLYDVMLPWLAEEVSFSSLENRYPSLTTYRLEATSTGKASKYAQWVHSLERKKAPETPTDFTTPQRSHSGATKALMASCAMLLHEFGMPKEMVKRVKFVIKYEFYLKGVEELVMLSRRHLALYGDAPASLPAHLHPLNIAVQTARTLGVNPQQSQRTISQLVEKVIEGKGLIRRTDGARTVVVPGTDFTKKGRSTIVYFGAKWCGPCKKVSPFVVEGYKSLISRLGDNSTCEFLFVSADRSQEDYDEYSEHFPFPKVGFPPNEGLFQAFGISSIPTLLVFGGDGTLLTTEGVAALMQDPEMLQYPGGPWSGAQPLTSTDVSVLGFANSVLSHHALKKFQQGLFNEAHVCKVSDLTKAVTGLIEALPCRNDEGTEELPIAFSRGSTDTKEPAGTLPSSATTALAALPKDAVEFDNTGMLNTAPTVQYAGAPYNSTVPELGDLSKFTVPTTMAELMLCMYNAEQHVNKLWQRAQHSGTSSRVAVQMQIIEFITWMFTSIIPIPRPNPADVAAAVAAAVTPQDKRQVATFAHVAAVAPANSANLVDRIVTLYNSITSTLYSEPMTSDGGEDADGSNNSHFRLASSIYRMMLSYATAWQSVENPTRAFDSERALTSMVMLSVFDAIVRNPVVATGASTDGYGDTGAAASTASSSSSMALLASLLNNSNGGYYVSTTLCKGTIPFKEASSTFELTRPRHLAVRDALVTLISFNEVKYRSELFDMRIPEKIELRKHSPTVEFLRRFIESCGYSLGGGGDEEEEEEQGGPTFAAPGSGMEHRIQQRIQQMLRGRGGRGGRGRGLQQEMGGNEMEKLMFWLCDSRSPLAADHAEFTMLRDMVLLTKFMGTMEMRDSQLLRKRKELDEFASWRLSFEEDTPGRQMSADWRTKPKPLFWELLMVRGRDLDIADIVVKGFGDREVSQYGEGLAIHSPIDVAAQLNLQSPMEEDVIHATSLPTFGGVLSQEEAEGLWSMLTVPYMRIPLVLDFFASQDRHTYLFSPAMQQVLRATLFEAGQYAPPLTDPTSRDANRAEVPLRLNGNQRQEAELALMMSATAEGDTTRLLGTSHGLLLNELLRSPQSVILPLLRILSTVTEGGSSSIYSVNATYALFLCGLACDVRDFIQYALESVLGTTSVDNADNDETEATQRNKEYLQSSQHALEDTLVKTLFPLLRGWRIEAEENDDIPSQCVVHSYLAMLWKTVSHKARVAALIAPADADNRRQEQEALWAMLRSCAFVRARHGFGMGIQRTQLAAQEGDAALSSEEKLMRFLQAQGLSTQQVTPELLEHGKRMMMAGGRRRAVFVQIRSRHFSDTVRIPNLIRSDPTSTSESKALKLPPVDVPENTLFSILQDNYPYLSTFINSCSEGQLAASSVAESEVPTFTLNGVIGSIVAAVLKDKTQDSDTPQSPTSQQPGALVHHGRWVRTGPDVYTAPASGLIFHLQTCELFWRDEEIKPVPDSMSHFSDYEAILGKDVVQCGRVSRTAHRHWVHVVGTPYDLVEWDSHDPSDQGVFQPMITAGPPDEEDISQMRYHNILYSRPIDIYEDDPWPIREERWAVNLVKQVYLEAYPQAGDMQYKVFLPEEVHVSPTPPPISAVAESDDNDAVSSGEVVLRDEIRMLLTDWKQYPEDEDRRTWKEVVVSRLTKVRPAQEDNTPGAAKKHTPYEGYELVDEDIRMNVFTLVPHARKMYRVLHFTTSLRTSLASLALLTKPRTLNEYFKTTRFQAGELKRRIKHEGTLEIHRFNHTLNGREIFLPPRLLQGVLPSSLLENMLFWHGEDDIIRGYPTSADDTSADESSPSSSTPDSQDTFASHWFNYAIEVVLGEGASPKVYNINASGHSVGGVSSCKIIRRNDGKHTKIREAAIDVGVREGIEGEAEKASLAQALGTLRGLFPDFKDRVLVYAFRQSRSHVAKTVDWLANPENSILIQALEEGTAAGLLPAASSAAAEAEVEEPTSPHGMSQRSNSMERANSCVELTALGVELTDDREDVSHAPLHLIRLHSSPEMAGLAAVLGRVEDFSHLLAWGHHDAEGTSALHVVEIPRLRAKFQPKEAAGGGRMHLWLVDNPGWRVAAGEEVRGDSRIAALMKPFDQCIVMFNATTKELALFVPNHDFARMDVAKDPMNKSLLFDRASMQWIESVPSPFYLLPLHPSREFLLPPSLPASLYCAVLLTAKREYAAAMRYMEACYVDTPFTSEEMFMFSLMGRTLTSAAGRSGDNHPDAHSARLKLAHSAMHSTNKVQWPLHQEVSKYLLKMRHVSSNCALSHEELTDLMKRCTRGSAVIKSQLEYWVAVAGGRSEASVRAPPAEKPGQPWEKLLSASSTLVMAAPKLTRLQFKPPKKALHDSDLVSFIWEDKLLLDEESGTNSSLGFFFLYSMKKKAPVANMQFLGKDVTATMDVLLSRYFHLRHARWGKEGVAEGETSHQMSFAMACLACMERFPAAQWPDLTDNLTLRFMTKGLDAATNLRRAVGGGGLNVPGEDDGFGSAYVSPLRRFFLDLENTVRRQIGENAKYIAFPMPEAPRVQVPCYNHVLPRPTPSNTAMSSVTLRVSADAHMPPATATSMGGFLFNEASLFEQFLLQERSTAAPSEDEDHLPFNLSGHPLAQSHVAKDMLTRLNTDAGRYAEQLRVATKYFLNDSRQGSKDCADINRWLGSSGSDAGILDQVSRTEHFLRELTDALTTMYDNDVAAVKALAEEVTNLANGMHNIPGTSSSSTSSEPILVTLHKLRLTKGSRSFVSVEWLCGALLSSTFEADLKKINPFHADVEAIRSLLVAFMLRSNRAHLGSQTIGQAQQLLGFMAMIRVLHSCTSNQGDALDDAILQLKALAGRFSVDFELSADDVTATLTSIAGGIKQHFQQFRRSLVDQLSIERHYATIDHNEAGAPTSVTLDPRFLVFEFVFSIVLRQRQVEMIRWFHSNITEGTSRVQQMIMGQGKTTVVGPILALMLADGATLVTQVMPTALLEQSRNVLRKCFSVVIPKQIYTLQFDRSVDDSDEVVESLYQKLASARKNRALIVSPPECIKALLLKYIEQLHSLEATTEDDLFGSLATMNDTRRDRESQIVREKATRRSKMADAIVPILKMWREGVLIMDEVDVLLHPLRSELNFPIGLKHPIDFAGPRWHLPIHILDGIYYHTRRTTCTALDASTDTPPANTFLHLPSILGDLDTVLKEGFECCALQREPHLVLLDIGFYHRRIKEVILRWAMVWLWDSISTAQAKEYRRRYKQREAAAVLHRQQHEALKVAEDSGAASQCSGELHQTEDGVPQLEQGQFVSIACEFLNNSRKLAIHTDTDINDFAGLLDLGARMKSILLPESIQLLFLTREWLDTLLPHVLAKINRVGFGILQPSDFAALAMHGGGEDPKTASMPISRKVMAIPFVAKDVPSRSSEFAHPDVVIGLTVLAYRYEGLRKSDVKELLLQLKQDYARQTGPRERRPASILYNHWARLARQSKGTGKDAESTTVPLAQLQVMDPTQLAGIYGLFRKLPEAIHYYLCQHIFPRTMNFQRIKISACGHELGSDILFNKRIGFSGTPSNLLPLDLGECFYEPGSDGKILSVLADPAVASAEELPEGWTPLAVLERIAKANPPFHALIDTGALITNLDNEQVARFLIRHLPTSFEGVVFLDQRDRQVVLQRNNLQVVPLAQCGIALSRRFTFFDQVHTTGMDVKQTPTATAAITIGKDMVFRDYAQGAYRMRGIGKGQTIRLYLIPEVVSRVKEVLPAEMQSLRHQLTVPAWLLLNAMRVEGLQYMKLCQQELENIWRKRALTGLIDDSQFAVDKPSSFTAFERVRRFAPSAQSGSRETTLKERLVASIETFREAIGYPIPDDIDVPITFARRLEEHMAAKPKLLLQEVSIHGLHSKESNTSEVEDASEDALSVERIQLVLSRIMGALSAHGGEADEELGLNTEVVHEQEAEEEQEQEAEQEEQRISAFSRDEEQQIAWDVRVLGAAAAGDEAHRGSPFYACSEFQVRSEQPKIPLPQWLTLSDNFFRAKWMGLGDRKLKNCTVFAQWLVGGGCVGGVVSLAEGETLRWLLHNNVSLNGSHPAQTGSGIGVAIRVVGSGAYIDASDRFHSAMTAVLSSGRAEEPDNYSSNFAPLSAFAMDFQRNNISGLSTAATANHQEVDFCDPMAVFFRFFNSDMFYTQRELAVLERHVLKDVPLSDRIAFFIECLRLRRRHRYEWEDAPVAALFIKDDEVDDLRCAAELRKLDDAFHKLRQKEEEYLRKEGDRKLEAANKLKEEDPELAAVLASTGGAAPQQPQYIDPNFLTEEEQLEAVMRESMGIVSHVAETAEDGTLQEAPHRTLFQTLRTSFATACAKAIQESSSSIPRLAPDVAAQCLLSAVREAIQRPAPITPDADGDSAPVKVIALPAVFASVDIKAAMESIETNALLLYEARSRAKSSALQYSQRQRHDKHSVVPETSTTDGLYLSYATIVGALPLLDAHYETKVAASKAAAETTSYTAGKKRSREEEPPVWDCPTCTYQNMRTTPQCAMCLTPKPGGVQDDEETSAPTTGIPWNCRTCTYYNEAIATQCGVCGADHPNPPKKQDAAPGAPAATGTGSFMGRPIPDGYWVCSPEHGGCSLFNPNSLYYCKECDKARPSLATLRF